MVERDTLVGLSLLTIGALFTAGFVIAQRVPGSWLANSVPTAALAVAVGIIGAVILLVVPDSGPRDSHKVMLNDAVRDIEMLLEEFGLRERAYFFEVEPGEVRAFIPIPQASRDGGIIWPASYAHSPPGKETSHLVFIYGSQTGLLLIPPGAQLVKLAAIEKGGDLESSLRVVLVDSSDLASSVLALEEEGSRTMKVKIERPSLGWESQLFAQCFGSAVSCIACCVAAVVKGQAVRIVDEKAEANLVTLTLEAV